jgi:peptidoglycan/LPS O-acetylase OafA/YrhL
MFEVERYTSAFPDKVSRLMHEGLWIFLPEAMVLCFAPLVALYDAERINPLSPSLITRTGGAFFALIGKVSYSGYMFHIYVLLFVDRVLKQLFGVEHVNPLILLPAFVCALIPAAWASFKVVEEPFLKLRKNYYYEAHRDLARRTGA